MKTILHTNLLALLLPCLIGCDAVSSTNELGLSQSDLNLGGPVDTKELIQKTIESAEGYFLAISDKLRQIAGGHYTVIPDLSRVGEIHGMGYKSSFYYFCWDIYLPFEFKTENGDSHLLIAQLSDRIPGNKHNTDRFHVIRLIILDRSGKRLEQIENKG